MIGTIKKSIKSSSKILGTKSQDMTKNGNHNRRVSKIAQRLQEFR